MERLIKRIVLGNSDNGRYIQALPIDPHSTITSDVLELLEKVINQQ